MALSLYRVTSTDYMRSFDGRGASFQLGARWNQAKLPVIYFASSPSLAKLEFANYVSTPRHIPKNYVIAEYVLDEGASVEIFFGDLPGDWDAFPYPSSTQAIGTEWLKSKRSLCLKVPSVADKLQVDHCYLVNPLHPEIDKIRYTKHDHEVYNKRAFRIVK